MLGITIWCQLYGHLTLDVIQRILKFSTVSLFAILDSINRIHICIAHKIRHVITLPEKMAGM